MIVHLSLNILFYQQQYLLFTFLIMFPISKPMHISLLKLIHAQTISIDNHSRCLLSYLLLLLFDNERKLHVNGLTK
jgi:hypothetical protein